MAMAKVVAALLMCFVAWKTGLLASDLLRFDSSCDFFPGKKNKNIHNQRHVEQPMRERIGKPLSSKIKERMWGPQNAPKQRFDF